MPTFGGAVPPGPVELRVGVLGSGAIGTVVADGLAAGRVSGCRLAGVVTRTGPATVADLVARCDLVVEAAGHDAVLEHADAILDAGVDLVLCSVGALARPELDNLHLKDHAQGRGRLLPVSGAVGGFDLLAALHLAGTIARAELTTTKQPAALGADVATATIVFAGSAREAALAYPSTANVAASIALATLGFDHTTVRVVADPDATGSTHELVVEAELGHYRFRFENRSAPGNPRTSAIVPWSVLALLVAEAERRHHPPRLRSGTGGDRP